MKVIPVPHHWLILALTALLTLLCNCAGTRHVPEGSYLLDNVRFSISDSTHSMDEDQMQMYVRQLPNHKFLWSAKLQLGIYNLSGKDTTKWYNKWIRRIGEQPVIYDPMLTNTSTNQLRQAMINKGFLNADVVADVQLNPNKKKADVTYRIDARNPHIIETIDYSVADAVLDSIVRQRQSHTYLKSGDLFDMSRLDAERDRITADLRNRGYYGFSKDMIRFSADTTLGSNAVDLTLIIDSLSLKRITKQDADGALSLQKNYIKNVYIIPDYTPGEEGFAPGKAYRDTLLYDGFKILSDGRLYLRPQVLVENCFLRPGTLFRQRNVTSTYNAYGRLPVLKFVNVQIIPTDDNLLDAYVYLTPGKSQSIALELEGTNSEGDLGVAASISYRHGNIGKGSETFTAKVRGAYESISGNLEGLLHNRYMEYSLDMGLDFPKFKAPFLKYETKRRIQASTKLHLSLNYQERPEYTRIIGAAGYSYNWLDTRANRRHAWTPIDVNYVYLPASTNDFINQIAPDNPLLRYSYEDHFIMSMAYRYYHSSKSTFSSTARRGFESFHTVRAHAETAGNLLYAINSIFTPREKTDLNPYKVFGIHYSQYVKAEGEYSWTRSFDARNTLAFRIGAGIAYPYANSGMVPFEKRFYGGGANGVRGWEVRTLGPGRYETANSVTSFINQCGDISFIASAEYRAKLFWVVEGALFIDVGNIWTIHNYESQPRGMFHFNSFYKELAGSYGLGLRLNFNYFLLRFDMGVKAHNPAFGQEQWPIIHPDWGRDASFHFSIGYPF